MNGGMIEWINHNSGFEISDSYFYEMYANVMADVYGLRLVESWHRHPAKRQIIQHINLCVQSAPNEYMAVIAMFHDISKFSTAAYSDTKKRWTHNGHAAESATKFLEYIAHKGPIWYELEELTEQEVKRIYEIIKRHMEIKHFPELNYNGMLKFVLKYENILDDLVAFNKLDWLSKPPQWQIDHEIGYGLMKIDANIKSIRTRINKVRNTHEVPEATDSWSLGMQRKFIMDRVLEMEPF